MSEGWYEVTAMGARYVFLVLAAAIVLLAWRDHRRAVRRSDRLRREGSFIGEMRVVGDVSGKLEGDIYPVPMEGCIGSARASDVRIKCKGLKGKHVYFEQREGCLLLTPMGSAKAEILPRRKGPLLLYDGDRLKMGGIMLVMSFYDADNAAGQR